MHISELPRKILSFPDFAQKEERVEDFSEEIMQVFLAVGSETPDNLNCYDHVEYGFVGEHALQIEDGYGLKVKGKPILLSEIANTMEGIDIPESIRLDFPSLTNQEWKAITRMITMVFLSLESQK
nr:hypothetical protein [Oscillochloris trichoides]